MATQVLTGGAAAAAAYTGAQTSVLPPGGAQPPPEKPPGPRRSALPWLLVLILLIASAAVGYVVYKQLSGGGATVPTLSGSCQTAKAQLAAANLNGVCQDKESSLARKGVVVGSNPSVGSSADRNSTVTVFIGAGPNAITVPDVHGKDGCRRRRSRGRVPGGSGADQRGLGEGRRGIVVGTNPPANRRNNRHRDQLRVATGTWSCPACPA
jgi:beta-lactam-binding protein with PASTA domain